MTRQDRIVALAQEGLSTKEIAHRLGCRPEYVRMAKRRADSAKRVINVNPSQPPTLQSQIVALVMQGCGDIEVAERVGCRREYVRVVRRRAGLLRPATVREAAFRRAEAKLIATIGSLEAKLADAKLQLAKLQKRASNKADEPWP
jgi:DNA-binding CsgD family transcriptional regulator